MKRISHIFEKIISVENLTLADISARKGKSKSKNVLLHDKNKNANILALHLSLKNKTFTTSEYKTFTIYDPKERVISSLKYYPDRIVHHAIINILEPIFVKTFIRNTFSCIKGRGIHDGLRCMKMALKDADNTKYCLKLDIKKFYPSIDNSILKKLIRRKIKDVDLLWLLDNIIDSTIGVPLGNYTSQFFANFYLTYFDHWIKENKNVKYYFRYADDMVIFSDNKPYLHKLLNDIRIYLETNLLLTVKENYQIFPTNVRGVDFLGYVFYHTHILLRKSIKKNFARMMKSDFNIQSYSSYSGWIKHCNGKHLLEKLICS